MLKVWAKSQFWEKSKNRNSRSPLWKATWCLPILTKTESVIYTPLQNYSDASQRSYRGTLHMQIKKKQKTAAWFMLSVRSGSNQLWPVVLHTCTALHAWFPRSWTNAYQWAYQCSSSPWNSFVSSVSMLSPCSLMLLAIKHGGATWSTSSLSYNYTIHKTSHVNNTISSPLLFKRPIFHTLAGLGWVSQKNFEDGCTTDFSQSTNQ